MDLNDLPKIGFVFLIAGMLFVIGIVILSSFQTTSSVGGDCTSVLYTDGGSDYFGVNNLSTNTTVMADNQLFGTYTAFTPRLNFTKNVSEVFTAGLAGSNNSLRWSNPQNFSNTLYLFNGTTLISSTNYTLLNSSATNWYINWKVSTYNGTSITVWFMRNFTKNVDDLVLNYTQIYTGSSVSSFLTFGGGTDYGVDKTFKLASSDLGDYLTGSNWAVTWSYYNRTCVTTTGNSAANSSITSTITVMSEIPSNWFLIIAVVIAASVVVGILINNLGKDNRV